jgi:hypothetical protein
MDESLAPVEMGQMSELPDFILYFLQITDSYYNVPIDWKPRQ